MIADQLVVMAYAACVGLLVGVVVVAVRVAVRHIWGMSFFAWGSHDDDHQDALDYEAYLSPCVCGAPRTDDHNGFLWRKHHGSTIAEADRRPLPPQDGLEKARW